MKKGSFFPVFYKWLFRFCFLYFSLVEGTHAACPVQLNPQRVVVKFGGSVSTDCNASVLHDGMGWKANEGAVPMTEDSLITWRVSDLREWNIQPFCFINYNDTQCQSELPVTLYKTPDSVSISTVNHNGPMMEGSQYELQCDVVNVAPVQNLNVKFYRGQILVNQTTFTDTSKTPVNETVRLLIRPNKTDDGAQYRCEAVLELGEEGPQPPPIVSSDPLNMTVYCPVQLNPQRVVVKFGGSVSADCNASVLHDGMGWEASEGAVPMTEASLITWRVSDLREWNIKPFCFINYNDTQCQSELPVTLYKTPDSVSISTVNHTEPLMEGNPYELQCDVLNVAPVQNLNVKWYRGQTLVNQTTFTDTSKTPVNETVRLLIHPDRADDGAQYRCEAELELGEGPQPPPIVSSDPLNMTVYFKPIINEIKLPSIVPVFRGYEMVLVCEAEGNPKPNISWSLSTNDPVYSETLTITDPTPEDVYCIASNSVNTTIRHVKVVLKENYMPTILGIIVPVVVIISIIFTYICCTYNKKNRKGHYNFKKPKADNGLLAQPAQVQ